MPLRRLALAGLPLVAAGAVAVVIATHAAASSSTGGWTGYVPEDTVRPDRAPTVALAVAFGGLAFSGAALVARFLTTRRLSPLASAAAASGVLAALPFASSVLELTGAHGLPLPTHVVWYAVLLPFLGAAAEVTEAAGRRPITSWFHVAVGAIAITGAGFWILDVVTGGPEPRLVALLLGIPVAIAYAAILLLLPAARGGVTPALLFVVASLLQLAPGLLLGVLAVAGSAPHLPDTQVAVAHLHSSILGGALFAFFAFVFHTNGRLRPRLANLQLALLLGGTNAQLVPLLIAGYRGMPRRVPDYAPEFEMPMGVNAAGAILSAAGIVVFLVNVLTSRRPEGPAAGPRRDGARGAPSRGRSADGS